MRITEEQGQPVEGALVYFTREHREDGGFFYYRMPDPLDSRRVPASGPLVLDDLPAGRYRFRASASGRSLRPDRHEIVLEPGQEVELSWQAKAGSAQPPMLSGTLRSRDGEPLAGVPLRAAFNESQSASKAVTEQDGAFSMACPVASGEEFVEWTEDDTLALVGPGSLAGFTQVVGGTEQVELIAAPAARVEGVVKWSNGEPAVGVQVSLLGNTRGSRDWITYGYTDLDGRFRFTGLGPQSRECALRVAGVEDHLHPESLVIQEGTVAEDLVIQLPPSGAVQGRIFTLDGQPAPGVYVSGTGSSTITNHEGEFLLPRLKAGRCTLAVCPFDEDYEYRRLHETSVVVQANDLLKDFEFRLPHENITEAGVIRGVVVWEDGTSVRAWAALRGESGHQSSGGTSEFVFEGVPFGSYELSAHVRAPESGITYVRSETHEVQPGDAPVRLVLRRSGLGSIRGRMVHPVTDVTAWLVSSHDGEGVGVQVDDEDGSVELPGITPGEFQLEMHAPGFEPLSTSCLVFAGQVTDVGEIELKRRPTLRGVVLDRHGRPIQGATIVSGSHPRPYQTESFLLGFQLEGPETRADGSFECTAYDHGLAVVKAGYAPLPVSVPSDLSEPLELVLRPSGALILANIPFEIANDSHGWNLSVESLDPPEVRGLYPEGSGARSMTRLGREQRFPHLPEGRYHVHFWKELPFPTELPDDPDELERLLLKRGRPEQPERGRYYRWQVDVHRGQPTTIDVGADW